MSQGASQVSGKLPGNRTHKPDRPLSLWRYLGLSPSLRRWQHTWNFCRAVAANLWFELRWAPMGVRRVNLWREDAGFQQLWREVRTRTALNPAKLFTLYQLAQNAALLPGEVAELGVYKGGSARFLARVFAGLGPRKKVLLFDTFAGLPTADRERDIYREGDLADTSLEGVQSYLGDCPSVLFFPGLFSDTLPQASDHRFCLVHIDADLFSSVDECCAFFYPRMVPGGIMLFDDYGFLSCPGARQAVDSFFADKAESPLYLFTGQCLAIKQAP